MSKENANDAIDLGSTPPDEFDPWADENELADDGTDEGANENETDNTAANEPGEASEPEVQPSAPAQTPKQTKTAVSGNDTAAESNNLLESAIGSAETKTAEKAAQSLYEKLPVFEYAGATENIEDASQTFEDLRIAKAEDFPELEDGKRVSWSVEYGKITKTVSDAKGTSVSKMKTDIEKSKEFMDALKKAKDKNPVCKVKPRVTAQSKGMALISGYKGIFANMDEVDEAGKALSILPARDGKVYEIRNNYLGKFITPVVGCELLSDVRAGYIPSPQIPRIPMDLTMRIIAFFRYLTVNGSSNEAEALVNIYWDTENGKFIVDTPEQIVSKVSVNSKENPDYSNSRYIHFMDIHSHNSMRAYFSATDNADEKATRLYTVIGRLDKYFPEIRTRISNCGKFHEIDPGEVFEHLTLPFPDDWKDKVSFRDSHRESDNDFADCGRDNYDSKINKGCLPWDEIVCDNGHRDSCACRAGDYL